MDSDTVVALVPARLDSTRLPKKQLRPVRGRAMLRYLVERMEAVDAVNEVVVATTDRTVDDPLASWTDDCSVALFRGAHEDVLQRLHAAAQAFEADIVVRANGDNPLLSPAVTRNGIERLQTAALDFVTGKRDYTELPVGLGPEFLWTDTLGKLRSATTVPSHREHVTSYIFEHPDEFDWEPVPVRSEWRARELRLTVDTRQDLDYIRSVVRALPDEHPSEWAVEDIIRVCRELSDDDDHD